MVEGGSRLDLRKKEKNATKHTAQKVASNEEAKFKWHCILLRTLGVIGSFCDTELPFSRLIPLDLTRSVFW